jgi:hypothetical protein
VSDDYGSLDRKLRNLFSGHYHFMNIVRYLDNLFKDYLLLRDVNCLDTDDLLYWRYNYYPCISFTCGR